MDSILYKSQDNLSIVTGRFRRYGLAIKGNSSVGAQGMTSTQEDDGMSGCQYTRHGYTCAWESDDETGDGFCILHSPNPEKDKDTFKEVLKAHREQHGDSFIGFVFPGDIDFSGSQFNRADFSDAKFIGTANFHKSVFIRQAKFDGVEFTKWAEFVRAEFGPGAWFNTAKFRDRARFTFCSFNGPVSFSGAEFNGIAYFFKSKFGGKTGSASGAFTFDSAQFAQAAIFGLTDFQGEADFSGSRFGGGASFQGVTFRGPSKFPGATFSGRTRFSPAIGGKPDKIFSGVEADFQNVIIEPLDALSVRDADLQKCKLQGTDLRKAEIANATWPEATVRVLGFKIGRRNAVYDEELLPKDRSRLLTCLRSFLPWASYQSSVETPTNTDEASWTQVEQLYRQLKQNYEDRRDYERASDFHYGEKEMRRQNPKTQLELRLLLLLYKWVSGYGERALRPLIWMSIALMVSTWAYLEWGLLQFKGTNAPVTCTHLLETGLYSLQVMLLLKPSNFEPVGLCGGIIYTAQSVLGPLLIGLFALAVRQRLKR